MDNNKTPMTPRQQSLNMRPLPNFLLTPASDDDSNINSNMRPTRLTTGQSTAVDFPSTPTPTPTTSKTPPPPSSSSPSFLASDTEAFVQACTSHLFTVTREISVLWPRLYPAFSSYTTPTTATTTAAYHSNTDKNKGNTTTLMHKCQRLHFEAVELLKAVLRAELAGSLDASASGEVLFATMPSGHVPTCDSGDAPGSVPGDMLAARTAAGSERLRLGRQVLWLLSRWNELKWLFGVEVDEAPRAVAKLDTTDRIVGGGAGARAGRGGRRGLDYEEDVRHDSGAEMQ